MCTWSPFANRVGRVLFTIEVGRYIAPSKLIKPTQMILEKAQQRSIIANGVRQWWGARFPWRIKDLQGWHVETHGWCTSKGKGLWGKGKGLWGKGKWVELVHAPQRGLETHKESKTHTWRGDYWITHVNGVPHWIMIKRMSS